MFTIFFKYLLSFNKLAKSGLSVDVRKQPNIQEAFLSEQAHSMTENANLSRGEPKTPIALNLSVGVFGPLINPYWLKRLPRLSKFCSLMAFTFKKYCVFYAVTNTKGKNEAWVFTIP